VVARLSASEARRLGIDVPGATRVRRPRRTAHDEPYGTRCHDCGESFASMAAEDRHLNETRQLRYELPIATRTEPGAAKLRSQEST